VNHVALTLINKNLALQLPEMLKEAVEQVHAMLYIMTTASLANRVHRELGVANIDSSGTQRSTQHWTNCASAGHVVAHDEHLEWHSLALSCGFRARQLEGSRLRATGALLQHDDTGRVGSVADVRVDLDDRSSVHMRLVFALVFCSVIRVDTVGHVGGDKEGSGKSLLVGGRGVVAGSAAVAADFVVTLFAGSRAARGQARETAEDTREHAAVGALCGRRANLFMIEAGNETDGRVGGESRRRFERLDQALDRAVGHAQVVETSREDELVVEASNACGLGVEENALEIDDSRSLDASILSEQCNEIRVVSLSRRLERLKRRVSLSLKLFLARLILSSSSAIELCRYQAGDWEQLSLLVELKRHASAKVYSQVGNPANGLVDPDQLLLDIAILVLDHQPSCHPEIAVEPSVPHATAVCFYTDLHEALAATLRDGLDAQTRRVGMRADHAYRVARLPAIANRKGNDRARVTCEVVLAAGPKGGGPGIAFL